MSFNFCPHPVLRPTTYHPPTVLPMRESLLIVLALSSEMVFRCGLTRRPPNEVRLQVKATRAVDLVVVTQEAHAAAQRRAEEAQWG